MHRRQKRNRSVLVLWKNSQKRGIWANFCKKADSSAGPCRSSVSLPACLTIRWSSPSFIIAARKRSRRPPKRMQRCTEQFHLQIFRNTTYLSADLAYTKDVGSRISSLPVRWQFIRSSILGTRNKKSVIHAERYRMEANNKKNTKSVRMLGVYSTRVREYPVKNIHRNNIISNAAGVQHVNQHFAITPN